MKKVLPLILVTLVLALAGNTYAALFNVINVAQFQTALTTAQSNTQDDTINVAAGTYTLVASLTYDSSENNALTIVGAGAGLTILDGDNSVRILDMDTTNVVGDAGADIVVRGMSFQKGDSGGNSGGALSIETNSADVAVENCQFSNNSATFADGGGLYVRTSSGAISFTNNTFSANSAGWEGGGASIYPSSGSVILTNNIFSGNTSANFGGGAYVHTNGVTVTMTNNTFAGTNTAVSGGGLYVALYVGTATGNIYNNILWGNTATTAGDDLYVDDDPNDTGTPATVNSFNNNYTQFAIKDGASLSQADNMNQDPLLKGDFHLQLGSPCINAGSATAPSLPATDCDGEPRTSGVAPDIGADEVQFVSAADGGGCFIAIVALND